MGKLATDEILTYIRVPNDSHFNRFLECCIDVGLVVKRPGEWGSVLYRYSRVSELW